MCIRDSVGSEMCIRDSDNDARFTEILLKVLRGFQNG
jgi:hypothetical protein